MRWLKQKKGKNKYEHRGQIYNWKYDEISMNYDKFYMKVYYLTIVNKYFDFPSNKSTHFYGSLTNDAVNTDSLIYMLQTNNCIKLSYNQYMLFLSFLSFEKFLEGERHLILLT